MADICLSRDGDSDAALYSAHNAFATIILCSTSNQGTIFWTLTGGFERVEVIHNEDWSVDDFGADHSVEYISKQSVPYHDLQN